MEAADQRWLHFVRPLGTGDDAWIAAREAGAGPRREVVARLLPVDVDAVAGRALQERLRQLGWVRHGGLPGPCEVVRAGSRLAVISEHVPGVDVRAIRTALRLAGVHLDTRVALELIAAVAAALDAAWSQPHAPGEPALRMLHRRLRPTCVRVLPNGVVNVLEVGWYGAEGRPHTTWSDGCAPEELFGEPATASGDVYALGALLFGLLAGEDFGPGGLRQVEHEDRFERRFKVLAAVREFKSADIEDAVHDVLYDMLAYGPQDRPTSAQVASRLRVIARRLQEPTLAGWASVAVPAIADAVDRFEQGRTNLGMAGRSVEDAPLDGPAEAGKGTVPPPIPSDPQARPVVAAGVPSGAGVPALRNLAPPVRVISKSSLSLPGVGNWEEDDEDAHTVVRAGLPPPLPPIGRAGPPAAARGLLSAPVMMAGALAMAGFVALGAAGLVAFVAAGLFFQSTELPEVAAEPEPGALAVAAPEADAELPAPLDDAGGAGADPAIAVVEAAEGAVVGDDEAAGEPPLVNNEAEGEEVTPPANPEPSLLVFASHMPDTSRVLVRCERARAEAAVEVVVAEADPGNCTVTAVDARRGRRVAVVAAPERRRYDCFEAGDNHCR